MIQMVQLCIALLQREAASVFQFEHHVPVTDRDYFGRVAVHQPQAIIVFRPADAVPGAQLDAFSSEASSDRTMLGVVASRTQPSGPRIGWVAVRLNAIANFHFATVAIRVTYRSYAVDAHHMWTVGAVTADKVASITATHTRRRQTRNARTVSRLPREPLPRLVIEPPRAGRASIQPNRGPAKPPEGRGRLAPGREASCPGKSRSWRTIDPT